MNNSDIHPAFAGKFNPDEEQALRKENKLNAAYAAADEASLAYKQHGNANSDEFQLPLSSEERIRLVERNLKHGETLVRRSDETNAAIDADYNKLLTQHRAYKRDVFENALAQLAVAAWEWHDMEWPKDEPTTQ